MNEYQKLLDLYSSDYYFIYSSLDKKTWDNEKIAETYLKQFWLPEDEYKSKWLPIQEKIFNFKSNSLPDLMFLESFHIFPFLGGVTLIEEEYEKLKNFMKETSDEYFVIIQNSIESEDSEFLPNLRIKYPMSATWNDLMSGGFISTVLFEMPHNDYFIFGDSGNWGKYIANDSETPLDLVGVKENFARLFESSFKNYGDKAEDLTASL